MNLLAQYIYSCVFSRSEMRAHFFNQGEGSGRGCPAKIPAKEDKMSCGRSSYRLASIEDVPFVTYSAGFSRPTLRESGVYGTAAETFRGLKIFRGLGYNHAVTRFAVPQ